MVLDQLTLSPLFLSFFSFFFVTVFLYKYWLCTAKTTLKNQPPSPTKFPIIGNLHQLGVDTHISLQSMAKKHGPLMLLHLGSVPVLVVSSADVAREILKTHDLVFSGRPRSMSTDVIFYNGKNVGFAQYSEHWRQVKSMCVVQLLSNRRVHSFHKVRDEEVTLLFQNINSGSTTVNLSKLFAEVTNNVIFRIVLGKKYSIGSEGNSFQNLFAEISVLIGKFSIGDYVPWLYWIDILSGLRGKVEKVAKKIDDFLEDVIRDHNTALANGTAATNQDFVSILLEFQKHNTDDAGFTIDKVSIKAVIMDMIFAGTHTTHATLEWTMAELIRNPKVMTKLQNEVREIGRGKSRIAENDLEKMHYLKAVIKENMRIKVPGPLLVRETREDVNVIGYDVKKGTQVLINAWAIARDPCFWDNPEEFCPERFLNSSIDYKGLHFDYLPFGGGRRVCPGIQFATLINELVVANVVHMFDFALPGGERMEDLDMAGVTGLTIQRKYPLCVIATPHDGVVC